MVKPPEKWRRLTIFGEPGREGSKFQASSSASELGLTSCAASSNWEMPSISRKDIFRAATKR